MFYDKFEELCEKKGISVTKALTEIGLSRGLGTKWRKTGAMPNGKTLAKISEYFDVPVDYFTRLSLSEALDIAMRTMPGYVDPMEELEKHAHHALPVDDELVPYLEILRDRPDLRALLEASSKNTPEDVERMTDLASRLRGDPFAD